MATQVEVQTPFQLVPVRPQLLEKGKYAKALLKGDVISSQVQIIADGGENNLHNHPANEAIWLVLQGQATFYTTGDEVAAVVDKNEMLFIPAGTLYWFETSSKSENLVILRIGARVPNGNEDRRVSIAEAKYQVGSDADSQTKMKREVIYKEAYFGD